MRLVAGRLDRPIVSSRPLASTLLSPTTCFLLLVLLPLLSFSFLSLGDDLSAEILVDGDRPRGAFEHRLVLLPTKFNQLRAIPSAGSEPLKALGTRFLVFAARLLPRALLKGDQPVPDTISLRAIPRAVNESLKA